MRIRYEMFYIAAYGSFRLGDRLKYKELLFIM